MTNKPHHLETNLNILLNNLINNQKINFCVIKINKLQKVNSNRKGILLRVYGGISSYDRRRNPRVPRTNIHRDTIQVLANGLPRTAYFGSDPLLSRKNTNV